VPAVLGLCAAISLLWLPFAIGMKPPEALANRVIRLPGEAAQAEALLARIRSAEGVVDLLVMSEENTVYLKVQIDRFDDGVIAQQEREPGQAGMARTSGQTA
jgi:hypothetical protein